mmetsp:Transcript_35277/g.90222  ORF Transcript_35277/g.90222 Transcript_35277/m.90222 type:complete len:213 (+) Transcript_35277:1271-1909(+)
MLCADAPPLALALILRRRGLMANGTPMRVVGPCWLGSIAGVYVAGVCADVASLHDMVGWRVQLRRGCMTTSGAHPPARCLPGGHALPNRRGERLDGLLQQAGEVGHVEADDAADVVAAVCLAGVVEVKVEGGVHCVQQGRVVVRLRGHIRQYGMLPTRGACAVVRLVHRAGAHALKLGHVAVEERVHRYELVEAVGYPLLARAAPAARHDGA